MTLDVRLLGQLAVIRDGHRLELRSRPAQMLLAYLVLHPDQSIPREKIAGILWPDSNTATARKNLRQTLWRLRRAIGDEHLEVDPRSLRLRSGKTTSDIAQLRRDDARDDPEVLVSVLESYRGELLPGCYEEWIQAASGPVRAAYEERMTRLLDVLTGQERWDELRDWSERWIAQGSVPERAYRGLMRAHAGLGDQAGFAGAYRRCRDALRDELGVETSAETRGLYRRLTTDPDLMMGPAKGESQSAVPMPSVRLVGSRAVVEAGATINRHHDVVYSTLLDPDIVPLCRPNVLEYEIMSGAPGKEGARVRVLRKMGTEIIEVIAEAIEADEGRWLRSRTIDSPIGIELETRFEDVAGGTMVTHRRVFDIPRRFFAGLDDSVVAQLYAVDLRSDFENLKLLLEE